MLRRGIPLFIVLFAAGVAAAENIKPTNASAPVKVADQASDSDRSACTPDVFRLCGQFVPDVDGIVGCLKQQRHNLSPACRAVFH
jgi:hypothetical protein